MRVERLDAVLRERLQRLTLVLGGSLALLACATGCDAKASAREEATTLLTGITALQDERSLSARHKALEALAKLPLTTAEHRRVRDLCRAAHAGLLQAEVEQATAKQAMDHAVPPGSGAKLPHEAGQAIASAISRSNASLADAQARFPECQKALQGLIEELR